MINKIIVAIIFFFINMRFIVMFVTAVCVLFLIRLQWPKRKNFNIHCVI